MTCSVQPATPRHVRPGHAVGMILCGLEVSRLLRAQKKKCSSILAVTVDPNLFLLTSGFCNFDGSVLLEPCGGQQQSPTKLASF